MFYISASSTISHQPAFQNAGFSGVIEPLLADSVLITPDYKGYIDAGLLRRMSKILRMSVACSKDCLNQAGIDQPDAIVVGTGLGCLQDTEKFLTNSITIEGLLPPTSFIQSTHNTMAGQISLSIGNHGYNMTHTQNTLSFENALQDAMLLLMEGQQHVLVGAADEYIEFLTQVSENLAAFDGQYLTSGASFFVISNQKTDTSAAAIKDCRSVGLVDDTEAEIISFLAENELNAADIDLILYAGYSKSNFEIFLKLGIDKSKCVDYLAYSGLYPSASAFALHIAADRIQHDKSVGNILIYNALVPHHLGLTLVQPVEA
ncbi:beta-ketoacyl synthase chain length factor [Dyadobacter sp. CY323]|uniref:beta-ketoacyl synthase chain length factor n=1 Tax=Dyadobacter sp. CY323 TaxID=2907302 RepID=UPI001F43BB94|nr:beta-ketoacyl synthase chain length factor [Dyadobacter sp. CY323]MCE6991333.1 beta-ketoacyl synthase chain length factor [Dyadobacter sp. CY323]